MSYSCHHCTDIQLHTGQWIKIYLSNWMFLTVSSLLLWEFKHLMAQGRQGLNKHTSVWYSQRRSSQKNVTVNSVFGALFPALGEHIHLLNWKKVCYPRAVRASADGIEETANMYLQQIRSHMEFTALTVPVFLKGFETKLRWVSSVTADKGNR